MKVNLATAGLYLSFVGFLAVAVLASALGISSTPFSLAIRALTFLVCFIFLVKSTKFKITNAKIFESFFILYFLLYICRIFYDTILIDRELSKPDYIYIVWTLGACVIPSIAGMKLEQKHIKKMQNPIFISLLLCSLLAALVATGNFQNDLTGKTKAIGRLNLTSLNPISIGMLGSLTIILSILRLMTSKKSFLVVALSFIGIFLGSYLAISSGSRGPILALLIAIMLLISNLSLAGKTVMSLFSFLFLVFIYFFAYWVRDNLGFHSIDRFTNTGQDFDGSALGRIQLFAGAINQFIENPITGIALEELTLKYYPHNLLLESFMATGILGGSLFIFLHLYLFFNSREILRESVFVRWVFVFHAYFFALSMFSGAIWNSTFLWISLGVAYGCIKDFRKRKINF